jgi:hypothetical protein
MSRLVALRVLLAVAAVSALAACASPTAPTPTSHLRAPSVNHDGVDCRSGYTIGQGVVCP